MPLRPSSCPLAAWWPLGARDQSPLPAPFPHLQHGLKQLRRAERPGLLGPSESSWHSWNPGTVSLLGHHCAGAPGPHPSAVSALDPETGRGPGALSVGACKTRPGLARPPALPGALGFAVALTWGGGLPHAPDAGGSCSSGWWGLPVAPGCQGLRVRDREADGTALVP